MTKLVLFLLCSLIVIPALAYAQDQFQTDTFKTSAGDLKITFIGHGTLMLTFGETIVHVDPWTRLADYAALPKADMILVTHEHGDHLDGEAIGKVSKPGTRIVWTESCANQFENMKGATVMKNGDDMTVGGLQIRALPAYNIIHKRASAPSFRPKGMDTNKTQARDSREPSRQVTDNNGQPFHPKGVGNGYIITWGGKTVYIAGDTENTPEMKALSNIDIAFLPMNLPYTMTPEMVADAARTFKPAILYPYHFGDTDTSKLISLMKDTPDVEIRIRDLQ